MPEDKIHGGCYLKARCIQESWIAHAPPHVREIWDWLLMKAEHRDGKGKLARGQLLTSYKDIQDGLSWMVGWRVQRYSKNDCETSMNLLRKYTMVHTEKTTRGMIVTILNYDKYQNLKNYETYKETYRKHTLVIQTTDTIDKKLRIEEVNNDKERKDLSLSPPSRNKNGSKPTPITLNLETFCWENITDDDLLRWGIAYPAVDIKTELARAAEWIRANPTKIKKNWLRFLTSWFSRSQERGGGKASNKIDDRPEWAKEVDERRKRAELGIH